MIIVTDFCLWKGCFQRIFVLLLYYYFLKFGVKSAWLPKRYSMFQHADSGHKSWTEPSCSIWFQGQDIDPFAETRTQPITHREDQYRQQRLSRAISPERSDPFAEGGKTPDPKLAQYKDIMKFQVCCLCTIAGSCKPQILNLPNTKTSWNFRCAACALSQVLVVSVVSPMYVWPVVFFALKHFGHF